MKNARGACPLIDVANWEKVKGITGSRCPEIGLSFTKEISRLMWWGHCVSFTKRNPHRDCDVCTVRQGSAQKKTDWNNVRALESLLGTQSRGRECVSLRMRER